MEKIARALDALIPAVEAIENCSSGNPGEIFASGVQTARKGAEATSEYAAKFGRAKNYKDASIGTVDCGALSMMFFLTVFINI